MLRGGNTTLSSRRSSRNYSKNPDERDTASADKRDTASTSTTTTAAASRTARHDERLSHRIHSTHHLPQVLQQHGAEEAISTAAAAITSLKSAKSSDSPRHDRGENRSSNSSSSNIRGRGRHVSALRQTITTRSKIVPSAELAEATVATASSAAKIITVSPTAEDTAKAAVDTAAVAAAATTLAGDGLAAVSRRDIDSTALERLAHAKHLSTALSRVLSAGLPTCIIKLMPVSLEAATEVTVALRDESREFLLELRTKVLHVVGRSADTERKRLKRYSQRLLMYCGKISSDGSYGEAEGLIKLAMMEDASYALSLTKLLFQVGSSCGTDNFAWWRKYGQALQRGTVDFAKRFLTGADYKQLECLPQRPGGPPIQLVKSPKVHASSHMARNSVTRRSRRHGTSDNGEVSSVTTATTSSSSSAVVSVAKNPTVIGSKLSKCSSMVASAEVGSGAGSGVGVGVRTSKDARPAVSTRKRRRLSAKVSTLSAPASSGPDRTTASVSTDTNTSRTAYPAVKVVASRAGPEKKRGRPKSTRTIFNNKCRSRRSRSNSSVPTGVNTISAHAVTDRRRRGRAFMPSELVVVPTREEHEATLSKLQSSSSSSPVATLDFIASPSYSVPRASSYSVSDSEIDEPIDGVDLLLSAASATVLPGDMSASQPAPEAAATDRSTAEVMAGMGTPTRRCRGGIVAGGSRRAGESDSVVVGATAASNQSPAATYHAVDPFSQHILVYTPNSPIGAGMATTSLFGSAAESPASGVRIGTDTNGAAATAYTHPQTSFVSELPDMTLSPMSPIIWSPLAGGRQVQVGGAEGSSSSIVSVFSPSQLPLGAAYLAARGHRIGDTSTGDVAVVANFPAADSAATSANIAGAGATLGGVDSPSLGAQASMAWITTAASNRSGATSPLSSRMTVSLATPQSWKESPHALNLMQLATANWNALDANAILDSVYRLLKEIGNVSAYDVEQLFCEANAKVHLYASEDPKDPSQAVLEARVGPLPIVPFGDELHRRNLLRRIEFAQTT